MKIATVTFHRSINYGAVLQAYALQQAIRALGHEAFVLDYVYPRTGTGVRSWFGRSVRSTLIKLKTRLQQTPFREFLRENVVLSDTAYTSLQQLRSTSPPVDAYVCGSDQIWNPSFLDDEAEQIYWLDFVSPCARKIAYAASFGVTKLSDQQRSRISGHAQRFLRISVREQDAVEIMRQLGVNTATLVPDPTLLIPVEFYRAFPARVLRLPQSYVFSYNLGADNRAGILQVTQTIKSLSKDNCASIACDHLLRGRFGRYLGPAEWLFALDHSMAVVTNSFHGLVFSLLFHKPFVVLPRTGADASMNTRLVSLLKIVGLEYRILDNCRPEHVEEIHKAGIDWPFVDDRLQKFRSEGLAYLRESLC